MVSHTATGEWQSFEARMRRRRAERLALRAEAAASAGFEDDARACLAEARTLAPDLPEITVAEAALAHHPEPLVIVPERAPSSRSAFIAFATASILLAAFVGGWLAYRDVPEAPDGTRESLNQVAAAPAPLTAPSTATARVTEPPAVPAPLTAPTAAQPVTERIRETRPEPLDVPRSQPITNAEAPIARDTRPAESSVPTAPQPVAANEALPRLPDVASAPPPSPAARVEPPPVVTPAAPTAAGLGDTVLRAPSVEVKAPVVEVSQEPRVQAVLNRYASAYSALDADAAERVWPTVNRGALARAFDGLASQRVNLGDCRIDVSGNKAHARCAGSATWSPKVGSGTHNESRVWTFDLVRIGADWQILNARAQNR